MKKPKGLLWFDLLIQIGIIALIFISAFFENGIFALLLFIPFGGWQVISSLIHTVGYGDRPRMYYLTVLVCWAAALFVLSLFPYIEILKVALAVSALALGIWYFLRTIYDFRRLMRAEKE